MMRVNGMCQASKKRKERKKRRTITANMRIHSILLFFTDRTSSEGRISVTNQKRDSLSFFS